MPVEIKWYKNGELQLLKDVRNFISECYISLAPSIAAGIKRRKSEEKDDWPSWLSIEVNTIYFGDATVKDGLQFMQEWQQNRRVIPSISNNDLKSLYQQLDDNSYTVEYYKVWK